jgi:predicted amidohydrolase
LFVIDTSLGRLGVSICADSHYSSVMTRLQGLDIDILIMPHAWPTMQSGGQDELEFARIVSQILRVPIVLVNGVGGMQPMEGIMGKLMTPEKFQLRGRSCIINAQGQLMGCLDREPGLLIRDVVPGESSNEKPAIPNDAGWIHPGSRILRKIIMPLDIWLGKMAYEKNRVKYQPPL